jgi:hypothetical protein
LWALFEDPTIEWPSKFLEIAHLAAWFGERLPASGRR